MGAKETIGEERSVNRAVVHVTNWPADAKKKNGIEFGEGGIKEHRVKKAGTRVFWLGRGLKERGQSC